MSSPYSCDVARREVLRLGLYAGGLAALGVPMSLGGIARAAEAAASGAFSSLLSSPVPTMD